MDGMPRSFGLPKTLELISEQDGRGNGSLICMRIREAGESSLNQVGTVASISLHHDAIRLHTIYLVQSM